MIRDTVSHLRARGAAGLPRRRALLRRLPVQPGLRAGGASAPPPRPAPTSSCCATPTAACCPTELADVVARGRGRDAAPGSASTATTTPPARWPTPWPRSTPASPTCRAPPTATASGPATPTCSASSPTCSSRRAARCCPDGGSAEMTRIAHAITEVTNVAAGHPPAVRRRCPPSRTRPGCTPAAIKVDPMLYQHIDPALVGNDMRMLVSDMAGRASVELKGRELGYDLSGDTERSAGSSTGSRTWRRAATPSRPPTPPSSCCCATSVDGRAAALLRRSSPGGSSSSGARTARWSARRRSSCTPRASGSSPPARATARSTRWTGRCGGAGADLPASWPRWSSSTTRSASWRAPHGTGAVTRVLIESSDGDRRVVHGRRRREHHRRLLAGAGGRRHLRPAARAGHVRRRSSGGPGRNRGFGHRPSGRVPAGRGPPCPGGGPGGASGEVRAVDPEADRALGRLQADLAAGARDRGLVRAGHHDRQQRPCGRGGDDRGGGLLLQVGGETQPW